MKTKNIIICIIIAFFCMGCDLNQKVVVSNEILQKKTYLENHSENNTEQHKDIEQISRIEFIQAINQIEVKSFSDIEVTEQNKSEKIDEEQKIKDRLVDKISKWYETNDVKYIIALSVFILFMFILVLYWFTRLINKLSPKKIGFTFVWVLMLLLIMIGITVCL